MRVNVTMLGRMGEGLVMSQSIRCRTAQGRVLDGSKGESLAVTGLISHLGI